MMKAFSLLVMLLGLLLFTYGAIKLAKSSDQQIESSGGFEVQTDGDQRHFALRISGTGMVLSLAGVAGFLLFARRRPQ